MPRVVAGAASGLQTALPRAAAPSGAQAGWQQAVQQSATPSTRRCVLARAAADDRPWKKKDCRLVLEDGSVWWGTSFGAKGTEIGEVRDMVWRGRSGANSDRVCVPSEPSLSLPRRSHCRWCSTRR